MEIRIGISHTGRELSLESNDSADAVRAKIAEALSADAAFVELTDAKGSSYIIPTAGIAFVEVGTDQTRRVGFVA